MNLTAPNEETLKIIQKAVNENEKTRNQYITHIKEWLKSEPHLPDDFDDKRILIFLRSSKFSLERCKQRLDTFFTVRAAFPEFFANRDFYDPEIQKVVKAFHIYILPRVTPEGYRLMMLKCNDQSINDHNFANTIKLIFMLADTRLVEENVAGDVYILDLSGITPSYIKTLTPTLFKKLAICTLDAYPIRVKAFHFVNVWPWLRTIIETLKPMLKEKIRNRFYFHSNLEQMFKQLPQELFPYEYGGKIGSGDDLQAAWVKSVEENAEWLKEKVNFKANESLRRNKSSKFDEFSVSGSFQQLTID